MIQKLLFSAAVIVSICSCGGGKKLESANAQITQLQANNKAVKKGPRCREATDRRSDDV